MALNGISGLSTKQLKQNAKLSAAATKRSADGRPSTLDKTLLPTVYTNNTVTIQSHPSGLAQGRPWTVGPPPPSYSVVSRANSVDEGTGLGTAFDITTTNVANGTTLYYTVTGSVTGADFASGSLPSGSFTINSDAGTVSFDLQADTLTEGSENYALQVRTGSISGTIVATSNTVTINDTSTSPSMTPEQLITNSDFSGGTTGWTASGGFGTYSYTAGSQIAINPDGYPQFSFTSRTLSRNVTVSSVTANASTFTAVVNIRHDDKATGGYTQIDTYNFTVVYKNSSGGTVITKTTGTSNAPQNFTDITLTLNRSEIPATFNTIDSAAITLTGIDTGSWAGQHGPVVRYITLTAS